MKNFKFYIFTLISSLFIGLCFTSSDFIAIPYANIKDILIITLQWSVLLFELYCLIFVLGVNKYVFAILFPLLTVTCTVLTYFRHTMGATLTPMIVDATLNNDMQTSMELVSPLLIAVVVFFFIISCLFVFYRLKFVKLKGKMIIPASIFFIALIFLPHVNRFRLAILERIPFNIYYTGYKYFDGKQAARAERPDISGDATCHEDSLTVILVFGESLRADHLPMNGYYRNTMPLLSEKDVISYPDIYSEFTFTVRSLPHMLTRADSTDYDRAYTERSFISFFNKCGFNTTWLANQESSSSYAYFMNECDSLFFANINKSDYSFGYWTDDDLLPLLDKTLELPNSKKLFILHTIGSHWWYNSHFTEEYAVFQPTIKSKIISSCTSEEMINSYDNTILFTDYFLSRIIDKIENDNSILIYQSDHGEALGEDGIWLHAVETPQLKNPACLVWMSQKYKEKHPEMYQAAKNNMSKRYRTDYLFHSILDAATIDTNYKDASLSIFRK